MLGASNGVVCGRCSSTTENEGHARQSDKKASAYGQTLIQAALPISARYCSGGKDTYITTTDLSDRSHAHFNTSLLPPDY